MTVTEADVAEAREVLRSIVNRWERQRYNSVLKDCAEGFLDLLDGVLPESGAPEEWSDICVHSQPLREAVAAAEAGGYGGTLVAAARSLLRAIDPAADSRGPGQS